MSISPEVMLGRLAELMDAKPAFMPQEHLVDAAIRRAVSAAPTVSRDNDGFWIHLKHGNRSEASFFVGSPREWTVAWAVLTSLCGEDNRDKKGE